MPIHVFCFVLGLCRMTGGVFIFKINISLENINSYGNIIFILHFLYHFQKGIMFSIKIRIYFPQEVNQIIKFVDRQFSLPPYFKPYRNFVQILSELILLYEVLKY